MMATLNGMRKSLTIWFNSLLLIAMQAFEYAAVALPQLQEYMNPNTYKLVGLIAVGGNILIRFRTNKPLKDK